MKFLILYMVLQRSTRNQNPTSLDESATSHPYITHTSINQNYETTSEFTRSPRVDKAMSTRSNIFSVRGKTTRCRGHRPKSIREVIPLAQAARMNLCLTKPITRTISYHITCQHKSHRLCPTITFVNKSAIFVSPSSFPTHRISAAAASRTA